MWYDARPEKKRQGEESTQKSVSTFEIVQMITPTTKKLQKQKAAREWNEKKIIEKTFGVGERNCLCLLTISWRLRLPWRCVNVFPNEYSKQFSFFIFGVVMESQGKTFLQKLAMVTRGIRRVAGERKLLFVSSLYFSCNNIAHETSNGIPISFDIAFQF